MLQDERLDNLFVTLRNALDGWQKKLWTGFPAIVQAGGVAADGTVTVVPAVRGKLRSVDGTVSDVQLPPLIKVPLLAFGGGGFSITAPVATGDEVLVVIANRCIDGWWSRGGVQSQMDVRMHSLSDGMAIPGLRSAPRALASYAGASLQLRSDDGAMSVSLNAGHVIEITAPGGCVINGVTIDASGNVLAPGEVTAKAGSGASVGLSTHDTTGVQGGGGTSGPPKPGT
jgi:hypothetical protein